MSDTTGCANARRFHGMILVALVALSGCGSPAADRATPESPAVVDAGDHESTPGQADSAVGQTNTISPGNHSDGLQSHDAAPPAVTADSPASDSPVGEAPQVNAESQASAQSVPSPKETQRREELFAGWPAPEFVLFITGEQHGYIEPCGCTGLANQKGGLVRRFTCKRELEKRGWPVVALDAGNQVRRFGRQPEIKFQMTVEGMQQIGYQCIGFGPDDLRLSVGELVALTASDGDQTSPFMCANTSVIDPSLTPAYRIVEAGGKKIGVTAVLGDEEQAKITSDEIIKRSAEDALRDVWSAWEKTPCDVYVLLANASLEASKELARKFPRFQVVVTSGGATEPAYEAEQIPDTDAILVQVGKKAMYVGVVGFFDDDRQPMRYQRVPLDARFADSPQMLQLLASYQDQLKAAGLEGLGVKPLPHPSGLAFVGSEACIDCHTDEFDVWENTPHSHALDSLVNPGERSEISRHLDPECISCHVVGWNPQKHFPFQSGYLSLEGSPLLHGVGCENCHGPGSAHVAAENGDTENLTDALIDELRKQMALPLAEAENKCLECHDLDNSPDFHIKGAFEEYWEQVEH